MAHGLFCDNGPFIHSTERHHRDVGTLSGVIPSLAWAGTRPAGSRPVNSRPSGTRPISSGPTHR